MFLYLFLNMQLPPPCAKLTVKAPERRHLRRSGFFNINFEHILNLLLPLSC